MPHRPVGAQWSDGLDRSASRGPSRNVGSSSRLRGSRPSGRGLGGTRLPRPPLRLPRNAARGGARLVRLLHPGRVGLRVPVGPGGLGDVGDAPRRRLARRRPRLVLLHHEVGLGSAPVRRPRREHRTGGVRRPRGSATRARAGRAAPGGGHRTGRPVGRLGGIPGRGGRTGRGAGRGSARGDGPRLRRPRRHPGRAGPVRQARPPRHRDDGRPFGPPDHRCRRLPGVRRLHGAADPPPPRGAGLRARAGPGGGPARDHPVRLRPGDRHSLGDDPGRRADPGGPRLARGRHLSRPGSTSPSGPTPSSGPRQVSMGEHHRTPGLAY
jgi:hypothetical protein